MSTETDKRRVKRFFVGEDDIVAMLRRDDHMPDYLYYAAKPSGLPEGAEILRVAHNFSRSAFELIIRHESFPVVEPFREVPENDPALTLERKVLCKGPDGAYRPPQTSPNSTTHVR